MKQQNIKDFTINRNISAKCWTENTRSGFRHLAELTFKDRIIENAKAVYYNRTWETFTYESVLKKLYNKAKENNSLSPYQLRKVDKFIKAGGRVEDDLKPLSMVGAVASLGELFCDNQKDKNDWKKRMLKAGTGEGLNFPDDWDELSEEEKKRRLDGAINQLTK